MKILALDSSGLVASAAVVEEMAVLAEYTVNYKKTHSQTLLPMIDEVMRMLELKPEDLDAVALAGGPGSFTGLRIGAATAKGLALALKKPLIPVPTVDALAYGLAGIAEHTVVPMMDARRGQVYAGIYRFSGDEMQVLHEQWPVPAGELAEMLNDRGEPVIFLGDGVPVHQELLKKTLTVPYTFAPPHLDRQRAASVGMLAVRYLAEGRTVDGPGFAPEYLRLSQAERERLERERSRPVIRPMTAEDIPQVAEIERTGFSEPWSEKSFRDMLARPEMIYLVAERADVSAPGGTKILGYAGASSAGGEGDINNIAVRGEDRNKGIGTMLLRELLTCAAEAGVRTMFLEVREHNEPALRLYRAVGFTPVGQRRGYYSRPDEDAVIMKRVEDTN